MPQIARLYQFAQIFFKNVLTLLRPMVIFLLLAQHPLLPVTIIYILDNIGS